MYEPRKIRKFGSLFTGNLAILALVLAGVLAACTSPAAPATPAATATKAAIATAASPVAVATTAPATATTAAPAATATTAATRAATVAVTIPAVTVPAGVASAVASAVAAAGNTIGGLAAPGAIVYARSCASCHGDRGQGTTGRPPVLPPDAKLGARFATAKDLDTFVRANMPRNAPGSLPAAEYDQVVAFLLAGNNLATATDEFTLARLEQIKLR